MKISWPWQKKKLLSLFEGSITAWLDSLTSNENRTPKAPTGPYRLNAPGSFYVENQECMACGYPHVLAPDLMEWERDECRESHCYFKKQPETAYELVQAIKAIRGSCCGALQNNGNDPEILKRLSES
jgi:hypothetical protein